jgi:uncharacterized protein with PIN domain
VLVTCDAKLAARRSRAPASLFLLPPAAGRAATAAFFCALSAHFRLVVGGPDDLMSRCAHCNGLGYDLIGADAAAAMGVVPEKLLRVETEFWRCRNAACAHLYWRGSKSDDTRALFEKLFSQGERAFEG